MKEQKYIYLAELKIYLAVPLEESKIFITYMKQILSIKFFSSFYKYFCVDIIIEACVIDCSINVRIKHYT